MIKYEVCSYLTDIKKVEIDRETEKSVFIGGCRRAKLSEYAKYFDSFEDAKNNLTERCKNNLNRAERNFTSARNDYNKVVYLEEEKS